MRLERKFGFNPPAGLFFDHSNFIPLERALGEETIRQYQEHYRDMEPPRDQLSWFNSHPDRSDAGIINSWSGKRIDDEQKSFDERVLYRFALLKAELRALMWVQAYGRQTPDIAELAWWRSPPGARPQ